jgi:phage shock protein A
MSSIFKRINDVITANINDLIDRVEDPERMVKQIIREMEENIRQAKEGVIDAVASEKKLEKEVTEHRKGSDEWRTKAETALQNGNEELARAALVRKNEHNMTLKSLEPAWAAAVSTSTSLKAQLRALEAKCDEAKRKKSALIVRQRAAEARQHMEHTHTAFETGLEAHGKFSRMEERVSEIEARTEAMMEVNNPVDPLEQELSRIEVNADIDAELAALKTKLQQQDP